MQTDVHIRYQEALDMSHHRRPTIIKTIFTGNHGHPHISINPDFLHWAYSHRTVSGITCFLGIHRDMVWSALLEHGIVKPQENPFQSHLEEPVVDVLPFESNELLDPLFYPTQYPSVRHPTTRTTHNIKWHQCWTFSFWCYFIHWTPVWHFRCQSWWLSHSSLLTFLACRN